MSNFWCFVIESSDGGKTVHADEPEICDMMATVGKKLNLAKHWSGVGLAQKQMYGPTGALKS